MFRLLVLNAKEWWLIILGLIGAGVSGSVMPVFAVLFGNILDVSDAVVLCVLHQHNTLLLVPFSGVCKT